MVGYCITKVRLIEVSWRFILICWLARLQLYCIFSMLDGKLAEITGNSVPYATGRKARGIAAGPTGILYM